MIKILACISMLIDHVGFIFFPDLIELRIIGRLAFPLFAFQVATGLLHTSDSGRYFCRLFYFGLLAQIPFMVLLQTTELNVLFTFSFAVLLVHILENKGIENIFLLFAMIASVFSIYLFYGMNYGLFGVSLVLCFYFLRKQCSAILSSYSCLGLFILLTCFAAKLEFGPLHLFGLMAAPVFFINFDRWNVNTHKYFFYVLYPTHLSVLWVISYVINL